MGVVRRRVASLVTSGVQKGVAGKGRGGRDIERRRASRRTGLISRPTATAPATPQFAFPPVRNSSFLPHVLVSILPNRAPVSIRQRIRERPKDAHHPRTRFRHAVLLPQLQVASHTQYRPWVPKEKPLLCLFPFSTQYNCLCQFHRLIIAYHCSVASVHEENCDSIVNSKSLLKSLIVFLLFEIRWTTLYVNYMSLLLFRIISMLKYTRKIATWL